MDIEERIQTAFSNVAAQFPKGGTDPAWTKAIKLAIGDLGVALDFEVCAAGVPERKHLREWQRGWLFDLTWYRGSENGILDLPLILESEWLRDYENIRWDFEKLLAGKADYKIMVFQATDTRIVEYLGLLKEAIKTYQGVKTGETYLLVCLNEDELAFTIENVRDA